MGTLLRGGSSLGAASAPVASNAILHGLLAVTHDPYLTNNEATALTAGSLHLIKVPWEATKVITTYVVWQGTTIGTGLANSYLCTVDQAGNVLVPTAESSTAFQGASNGLASYAAATPAAVPGSPGNWVWLGLMVGAATASPTFGNWGSTLNSTLTNFNVNGGAATRCGRIALGNVALPASITVASIVTTVGRFLIGVK